MLKSDDGKYEISDEVLLNDGHIECLLIKAGKE